MADALGNNWPKLHNATWPGVVGKGPDAEEPFIELDTMLDLTAKAEVNGTRFEGFDLFSRRTAFRHRQRRRGDRGAGRQGARP